MAFQAAAGDGSVENGFTGKAGTIAPLRFCSKPGDGQLKKPVALPAGIALSFGSGAKYQVHSTALTVLALQIGCLINRISNLLHTHFKPGTKPKTVLASIQRTQDALFAAPC